MYTVCAGIDVVFHAAALKQVPSAELYPLEAVNTNIIGSHNLVRAAIERGVKHVVAISTDKAVKPVNAMGMTKALQEKIMLSEDLEKDRTTFCCVRYGNVLGSRGSVIPEFLKQRKTGKLQVTDLNMTRFNITLDESVDFVLWVLSNALGGEIFVSKIPSMKVVDITKTISSKAKIKYIGIRPGEKIHENTL